MVKSADKKPEKYVGPDGKPKIRMVATDKEVLKKEMSFKEMRRKHAAKKGMTNEAYDTEPASYDEKSMAMRQAKFIQYVGEEIMEHMQQNNDFPEWMQNKLSEFHQKAKDMHAVLAGEYEDDDMDEEMNEYGGPPISRAKYLKQKPMKEDVTKMSHGRLKFHMNNKNIPHGSHSFDKMKAERDRRLATGQGDAYKKAKASMSEVAEATDADYHKTLGPTKNSDEGIAALKKKHGMSHAKATATIKRLMGESVEEAVGTSAKYAGKSGMFGGKYTSKDHMLGMKNFSQVRKKRQDQRDAEHKQQDPKMAKMGYAKHMMDTDKADAKARKRGIDPTGKYDKYKKRNDVKEFVKKHD